MPRTLRQPPAAAKRRGVRRRPTHADSMEVLGPRVLSPEEKRELILAHHAARKSRGERHPAWGWGYYVGIVASCLVILTGWWMTLGTSLSFDIQPSQQSAGAILQSGVDQLKSSWANGTKQDATNVVDQVKQQYQQAILQEKAMEAAAKEIKAMQSSTSSTNSTSTIR